MADYKGQGTPITGTDLTPVRVMDKYVAWVKLQLGPRLLAITDDTIEQSVENSVRYWNNHSGYKISTMIDVDAGSSTAYEINARFKQVLRVYPSRTTTWMWNDHPMWTLLGVRVMDNVTSDLIILTEGYKNYRAYLGTDFQWTFEKSDTPGQPGKLYVAHVPGGAPKLAIVGTKAIVDTEDIREEIILDWVLHYTLAQVKIAEGHTLRAGMTIDVKIDGPELLAEGNAEKEKLQEQLQLEGRWVALARRF
jgi:hypothetical protein